MANESEDFSFPYSPYEIQSQFMHTLYSTLESGKLGIFESPTGTGKSLSIICGALTWLEQHTRAHKEHLEEVIEKFIEEDDPTDWFNSALKRIEKEKHRVKCGKELEKIEKYEEKIKNLKLKKEHSKKSFVLSNKKDEASISSNDKVTPEEGEVDPSMPENEFLLNDYNSEDENDSHESDDEEEEDGCLKIFYCSRTHSQLSQFVKEVQKTRFRADARVVTLASRQNLCINEAVAKLPSQSMINERCLDLQRSKKGVTTQSDGDNRTKKKKTSSGCPYNKQTNIHNLSDEVLADVQDIEELVGAGRKKKACPYYASRKSVKDCQLVVLPYNCLLHKGTREACHINLKDNIVIVDEAHNLLETLGNIHSAILSLPQIVCAQGQLMEYLRRYEKRLSPKNLLYIRQILFILKAYRKLLSGESVLGGNSSFKTSTTDSSTNSTSSSRSNSCRLFKLQFFLFETLTDNFNLFKLIQYMEKSRIAHKLHGYKKFFEGEVQTNSINPIQEKQTTSSFLARMAAKGKDSKTTNKKYQESNEVPVGLENEVSAKTDKENEPLGGAPLLSLIEFLKAITHSTNEGRIFTVFSQDPKKSFVKYLLLNPASQFHEIVKQCRSVIVAGGTMSPMDEFKNQLFLAAGASPEHVVGFSCGHVVAQENVLPLILTKGPGNTLMDFTFKNRSEPTVLTDLGRTLINACNVIPGGVVCFLPSYEYEETVNAFFRRTQVLDRIAVKKKVFREPKKSSEMEKILASYSQAARSTASQGGPNGALLFSVVGGKMSEGINFSDELGRCVVMVGLPYPNANSPELKEKINYLNQHFPPCDGKTAGASYYENLCFKAVNQSIGRSIRHRNDYASILLIDHRYAQESCRDHLPSWISPKIKVCDQFGQAVSSLRKFFSEKK